MATIIIGGGLFLLLVFVARGMIRDKKQGKSCCSDCSTCGAGCKR